MRRFERDARVRAAVSLSTGFQEISAAPDRSGGMALMRETR